ncbi:unnamed protein product [Linum trigynum]|uniref:Uncharacterized protein n=1 Tax=Linum trigynum TaxID=586398 RepID=A0AAV2GTA1_9ROSI
MGFSSGEEIHILVLLLAAALANATPYQQRAMLGPDRGSTIVESPDGLQAKVAEPMAMLGSAQLHQAAGGTADQLFLLSFNDQLSLLSLNDNLVS